MLRSQQGILSEGTNPVLDADVIMTAAVVGHAFQRLRNRKNCFFDAEVQLGEHAVIDSNRQAIDNLQSVVNKINTSLISELGSRSQLAQVGVTPIHDRDGQVVRITGGTGDLPADDLRRYYPDMPKGWSLKLYRHASELGYQGRGAYTGFVDARESGQSALTPTIRIVATETDSQVRWLPTASSFDVGATAMGARLGAADNERTWGMIGTNQTQEQLRQQGMHFKQNATPNPGTDVVGYTHGMIQAIYDVRMWEIEHGGGKGGTPYEIAVGNHTTKLASCFPCAIFMEANGFPASSTHLGRGESWCPLHPVHHPAANKQARAWGRCNDAWAAYCQSILVSGVTIIARGGGVRPDHQDSFEALQQRQLTRSYGYTCANLILDAITVHDKEENRIRRTLPD